jgi:hypothetical protein
MLLLPTIKRAWPRLLRARRGTATKKGRALGLTPPRRVLGLGETADPRLSARQARSIAEVSEPPISAMASQLAKIE